MNYKGNMKRHETKTLFVKRVTSLCSCVVGSKGVHPRRLLGEPLDQTVIPTAACFCVTADNRFIIACGYWDKSFKIFSTDSGKYSFNTLIVSLATCTY